jgi:hypothetical protein
MEISPKTWRPSCAGDRSQSASRAAGAKLHADKFKPNQDPLQKQQGIGLREPDGLKFEF